MKVKILFSFAASVLLAACTTTDSDSLSSAGGSSSAKAQIDPESKGRGISGLQEFTYVNDQGETFNIGFVWDGLLRGYGTEISRVGILLSSDGADDALVQNTLRNFFNREICSQGYFAGITTPYGAMDSKPGTWGAKVKCTTKQQANI
ncbi:MAG: hypothetical protein WBC71_03590 [Salaquimonas sp.]